MSFRRDREVKLSSVTSDHICHICGDKAPGRNYGGISCESCKAFFRRVINTKKAIKCKSGEDNCEINKDNRTSCKKCRYRKCIAFGMIKEMVNKCEDKKKVENQMTSSIDNESDLSSVTPLSGNTCPEFDQNSKSDSTANTSEDTIDLLPNLDPIETEIEDYCLTGEELSEGIRRMEELLSDSQSNDTEVNTRSSVMAIVRPIATFDKPFNDIELSRLCELTEASNQFKSFTNCSHIEYRLEFKDLKEMYETMSSLQIYDRLITESSSFCKKITLFKDVCEQDKLSLFKFACWKLISLKYLSAYNPDKTFTFAINNDYYIRGDLSIFKTDNQLFYGLSNQFWEGLNPEWIRHPILINLMMALALFNCDAPNLAHRYLIKLHQQMYYYLLQRYLLQKFRSEDKSSENLSLLMGLLCDLHQLYLVELAIVKDYFQLLSPLTKELIDI